MTDFTDEAHELRAELAEARAEAARLREALTVSDRANWAAHVCIRENLPGFVGDLQLLADAQDMTRNAIASTAGRDYRDAVLEEAAQRFDKRSGAWDAWFIADEIRSMKRGGK